MNVSKGGTSITVGKKGFHLNFGKHGVRQTTSLPGSGISHTSYLYKNDEDDEEKDEEKKEAERDSTERADEAPKKRRTRRTVKEQASSLWGFFAFVLIALFFFYFGASAFGLIPRNMLTDLLSTLTQWAQQVGL